MADNGITVTPNEFARAVNQLIEAKQREQAMLAARSGAAPLDGTTPGYEAAVDVGSALASFAYVSYAPSPIFADVRDQADGTRVTTVIVSAQVVGWRADPTLVDASNPSKGTATDAFSGVFPGSNWATSF